MAISLAWTMNYILVEKKMQESRKSRAGFEAFMQGLRQDLQDGFQCSRFLAGQPFPRWSTMVGAAQPEFDTSNEVDIQIRDYIWRKIDGTELKFDDVSGNGQLRGDNPATIGFDGAVIPDLGIANLIGIAHADVATGNVLISGGVDTAPLWGKVTLGTHTTGKIGRAHV